MLETNQLNQKALVFCQLATVHLTAYVKGICVFVVIARETIPRPKASLCSAETSSQMAALELCVATSAAVALSHGWKLRVHLVTGRS